jgi:hypothetical protein
MGAFLSSEDVARKQDVDSTYLKQSEAVSDYVRRTPYDEDQKGMRSEYQKYTNERITGVRGGYTDTMKKIDDDYNLADLRLGYTLCANYGNTGIYAKYYPNSTFKETQGPNLNTFCIGFKFGLD